MSTSRRALATAWFTHIWTHVPRTVVGTSRLHVALNKATKGRFFRRWFFGAPVMLLETTGRKTGERRTTPVLYLHDGDNLVVVPANAGARRTPAWWLNLQANGKGTAILDGERIRVRPRVATPEERERLWPELAAGYPPLDEYGRFTPREIPVVILERDPAGAAD